MGLDWVRSGGSGWSCSWLEVNLENRMKLYCPPEWNIIAVDLQNKEQEPKTNVVIRSHEKEKHVQYTTVLQYYYSTRVELDQLDSFLWPRV